MPLDYATLTTLRDRHPAWRLLASPHAPLVASFLHLVFVVPNVRVMDEADFAEALEDELFRLREQGEDYAKAAADYLNDYTQSLLMNRQTLMEHQPQWGEEPQGKRCERPLARLTTEENELFEDLRLDRIKPRLRLEQEHIGYPWLCATLAALDNIPKP